MDIQAFIKQWHQIVANREIRQLDQILDESAALVSPVLHTAKEGQQITKMYLTAALNVFANDSFKYIREFTREDGVVFEFETQINGIYINGIDMITINDAGKIIEFRVMVRPLKALNLINEMMTSMLSSLK